MKVWHIDLKIWRQRRTEREQFYYDLSDREAEERIRDSLAIRWFLGFKVGDRTPDHNFFWTNKGDIGHEARPSALGGDQPQSERKRRMKSLEQRP